MAGLFRFLLPLGLASLLLAGCCANGACNCQDERADALYFNFVTSTGGFVPERELDTVLLKRFALQLDSKGKPALLKTQKKTYTLYADSLNAAGSFDLVTIIRATALRRDTVTISNNLPFAQSGSRKLNTYLYRLEVRNAPEQPLRNNPRRYELRDSVLQGEFYGDGCCTCYRNISKIAKLRNLTTNSIQTVDGTEPKLNQPVYIPITK